MNWKEFFNPTWGKVIILFFLFPVLFFIQGIIGTQASSIGNLTLAHINLFIGIIAQPFIFLEQFLKIANSVLTMVFTILDFVYWYFLSSLIVGIYNKLKRK